MVLSGIMLVGGVMMKRLAAYSLALTGAILAILVTPGNLIGLPIGIWALVVLSRREVREAFGKGLPMPAPAMGQSSRSGGGWKVAAVIVVGVMILLAIPIGAMIPEIQALNEAVKRGSQAWSSGDYSKALALLLPAALKGDPDAQHRIGVMYIMGQGVEQDLAEATRWFRKAAEPGQGESQNSMGMRYLLGESVVQDQKEAVRWFKLAAEQGIAVAESTLALRYSKGEGVAQDYVAAYKWAMLASAELGPNGGSLPPSHLEEKLTPDQRAAAQRRAKEFVPKRTAPADP